MLSRIPVDEKGQFPVNAHLVAALTTGFLFFNELLFWLVAELMVRESRMALAGRFYWLAAMAALLVWVSLVVLQWRERSWRKFDVIAMTLGLAWLGAACRHLPPWPLEMACTSLLLMAWSFRGFLRKKIRAKKNAA